MNGSRSSRVRQIRQLDNEKEFTPQRSEVRDAARVVLALVVLDAPPNWMHGTACNKAWFGTACGMESRPNIDRVDMAERKQGGMALPARRHRRMQKVVQGNG